MMWSRVVLTLSKVFSVASAFAPPPKAAPTPPPSLMWRLFEEATRGKLSLALQEMLNLYKGEDKNAKENPEDLYGRTWSSLSDEYKMDESMVSAMDAVNRFLEEQAESDRAAHRARLQLQRELVAADMAALHAEIHRLRAVVAEQHKELMRVRGAATISSSVVGVAVAEEVKYSNPSKQDS